ncbi:MAG: GNAT family N-acetyltransferase [Candidatus Omnitrophica bacterium]|nr:GNAT family N-acetyltransferase [Candidatus Omnitrophota bacterium]
MNFLIDTNILIPLEPASAKDLEPVFSLGPDFVRLTQNSGSKIFVHPVIQHDLDKDKDKDRRALRAKLIKKYNELQAPPGIERVNDVLSLNPPALSNDWVDHHLLSAVLNNSIDYLVTEDVKIHSKAEKLGIGSRVLYLFDAIDFLKELFDVIPETPPSVEVVLAHELNEKESFFDSLREDYSGFDNWFVKSCKTQHRKCYVIKPNQVNFQIAGLCIIKEEDVEPTSGSKAKVLKLCTFKVAPEFEGNKYGELLLKTIFDYVEVNKYDYTYFTVKEKHQRLMQFASDFGFEKIEHSKEEWIMLKRFKYSQKELDGLSALDFHIKFGPFRTRFDTNFSYIIPIKPEYHKVLFPETSEQHSLWPDEKPCGNSIKKAYLSHSTTNRLKKGDNIFFYRSHDTQGVTCLGIVEDTLRTKDVNSLAKYVGQRTVYSFNNLKDMCKKEVLAIRFRLVKKFDFPICIDDLKGNNVIKGSPQSITRIGESIKWLQRQIGM